VRPPTYARLSLLIPILAWVSSLLLLLTAFALLPDLQTTSETPTLVAVVGALLLFYVIGIVYWLIPYLLVSLVLLLISFKSTERVLRVVYLLSPLLMAIMILIVVTTLKITPAEGSLLVSDLTSNYHDSVGTGVLFAFITLVWGYLCVGLGFGGYKLLQQFGTIKEEKKINSETIAVNSQEVRQEVQ
jgi:hypothetical protein